MPPPRRAGAVPRTAALCSLAVGIAVLTGGCGLHLSFGRHSATPSSNATGTTGLPSTVPSNLPSNLPSGLPSGIPTKVPTSRPASPSATTGGGGKLTAKDGTKVGACRDGRCEILVKKTPQRIRLAPKYRVSRLVVVRISSHRIKIVDDFGYVAGGPGNTFGLNGIAIDVLAVQGHTAKLRFRPR